jgi:alkylated DNA repair dioxygenase AlkB
LLVTSRDKDRDFVLGSSVLTISFGAVRRLLLKSDDESETVELEHGSLFVLGPETNAPGNFKHSIVKTAQDVGERLSLTFRSIKTRYDPSTKEVAEA